MNKEMSLRRLDPQEHLEASWMNTHSGNLSDVYADTHLQDHEIWATNGSIQFLEHMKHLHQDTRYTGFRK